MVGRVGKLPEPVTEIEIKYTSLERNDIPKQAFKPNEPLMLGIGTGTNVGYVKVAKKNSLTIDLRHPACIDKNTKISVLRNLSQRWHLSGYGTIVA
jgi:translation initiation factor 2 subunit 3